MRLECPLMLSPDETGTVSAEIVNRTEGEIKPVVIAEISRASAARRTNETFVLEPGESQVLRWDVNSSDVIFERLILVNILQSQYRDNPSWSGSCGILLFGLFGLTGVQTFGLIIMGVITSLLIGGGLWFYSRRPLEGMDLSIVQAHAMLGVLTNAALLSSIPRWWGLTLLLETIIMLMIGVILVEFILFPKNEAQ